VSGHAGTRHSLIKEESSIKFQLPSEVNSFHDFVIPRKLLGEGLTPLAYDNEGNIEAFYNQEDKVIGIMWHPEREKNFLKSDCDLIKSHFGL
jgi:putative glutamine amidotransferase